MLPSNLNLSIGKKKGCNNKILVTNRFVKISANKDINKDHKIFPAIPPDDDVLKIGILQPNMRT